MGTLLGGSYCKTRADKENEIYLNLTESCFFEGGSSSLVLHEFPVSLEEFHNHCSRVGRLKIMWSNCGPRGHLTPPRNPFWVRLRRSQTGRLWGELWPDPQWTSVGSTGRLHSSSVSARNQPDRGRLISQLWSECAVQTLRQRPTYSSLPWHAPGYRCSLSLWLVVTVGDTAVFDSRGFFHVHLVWKTARPQCLLWSSL